MLPPQSLPVRRFVTAHGLSFSGSRKENIKPSSGPSVLSAFSMGCNESSNASHYDTGLDFDYATPLEQPTIAHSKPGIIYVYKAVIWQSPPRRSLLLTHFTYLYIH